MSNTGQDNSNTLPRKGRTELTALVTRNALQRLQDRFAALGQVTVCICTVDGTLITRPTWGSRFSELIGSSPQGRTMFAKAIRDCAQDPNRSEPVECHDGMTLSAAPIHHDGHRLAVIIVGTRAPDCPPRESVIGTARAYGIDSEELWEWGSQIDPYSGGTSVRTARRRNCPDDKIRYRGRDEKSKAAARLKNRAKGND